MSVKKLIFIALGSVCLALGTVGVFLPILPTVPFYLATAYFYARSSDKLNNWFKNTRLYKNNLESFVNKQGMPKKTKAGIITSVTLLMGIGFFLMARKGIWIPCIILAIVWLCHIVYFVFGVKNA